jgi:hypothetical protein
VTPFVVMALPSVAGLPSIDIVLTVANHRFSYSDNKFMIVDSLVILSSMLLLFQLNL